MRPIAIVIVLTATPALAQQTGDRCDVRGDCVNGLRCVQNRCVDAATPAPQPAPKTEPADDEKDRAHAYMGGVLGGLLPVIWFNGGAGIQFGIRGGMMLGGLQLQLEVAPATAMFGVTNGDPVALLDVVGTIGYLIPMNETVSWIVRFGGGGGALLNAAPRFGGFGVPPGVTNMGFGEFRADVAGVAIRTSKHLMVECNAPSFRMIIPPSTGGGTTVMVMWVTNVGIDYIF